MLERRWRESCVESACYLSSQAQLHILWEEVEGRRRECETLRQELETAQRTTALSSVLDAQV